MTETRSLTEHQESKLDESVDISKIESFDLSLLPPNEPQINKIANLPDIITEEETLCSNDKEIKLSKNISQTIINADIIKITDLSLSTDQMMDTLNYVKNKKRKSKRSAKGAVGSTLKYMIFPGNGPEVIRQALQKRAHLEEIMHTEDPDFQNLCFLWKPTNFHKIFNHFENLRGIGTKTGLIKTLKRYYKIIPGKENSHSVFDFTPTTFILTSDTEDNEYFNFIQRFKELSLGHCMKEKMPLKHCEKNIWLVKPAAMNQGKGIEIFGNLRDIKGFINSKNTGSHWVVQKYIEKPLLFKGRKFDIRMWALITHRKELFFYREGYVRTSSSQFGWDSMGNYVHLTNHCLQIHGTNYGEHEEGNTLSFVDLKKYLDECYPQYNIDLDKDILDRMRDLVVDTFCSIKADLTIQKRKNCFELLGYDFMIDEDFRIWLLEVNTNPYLGTPNTYIKELVPRMIDDMLELVLDPFYPPPTINFSKRKNGFELIYCERPTLICDGPVCKRNPVDTTALYPIEECRQQNSRQIIVERIYKNKHMKKDRGIGSSISGIADNYKLRRSPSPLNLHTKKAREKNTTVIVHGKSTPSPGPINMRSVDHTATSRLKREHPKLEREREREREAAFDPTPPPVKSLHGHPTSFATQSKDEAYHKTSHHHHHPRGGSINLGNPKITTERTADNYGEEDASLVRRKMLNYNHNRITKLKSGVTSLDQVKEILRTGSQSIVYGFFSELITILIATPSNEKEVTNALNIINYFIQSKLLVFFVESIYFKQLAKVGLDLKSEIPLRVRQHIFSLLLVMSHDKQMRKVIIESEISQQLMDLILHSCQKFHFQEEFFIFYELGVKILGCIANIHKSKYYIPGETIENERMRIKFIQDGGLLSLYYTSKNSFSQNLRFYAKKQLLQDFDIEDLEIQIAMIAKYVATHSEDELSGANTRSTDKRRNGGPNGSPGSPNTSMSSRVWKEQKIVNKGSPNTNKMPTKPVLDGNLYIPGGINILGVGSPSPSTKNISLPKRGKDRSFDTSISPSPTPHNHIDHGVIITPSRSNPDIEFQQQPPPYSPMNSHNKTFELTTQIREEEEGADIDLGDIEPLQTQFGNSNKVAVGGRNISNMQSIDSLTLDNIRVNGGTKSPLPPASFTSQSPTTRDNMNITPDIKIMDDLFNSVYHRSNPASIHKRQLSKLQLAVFLDLCLGKEINLTDSFKKVVNLGGCIGDLKELIDDRRQTVKDKMDKQKKINGINEELNKKERKSQQPDITSDYNIIILKNEQKKKDRVDNIKKDLEGKLREEEKKRKSFLSMLKKKEDDRKARQLERVKKLAYQRRITEDKKQQKLPMKVDEIYKNLLEDWQREKRKAVAEMKQKHVKKGSIAVVNGKGDLSDSNSFILTHTTNLGSKNPTDETNNGSGIQLGHVDSELVNTYTTNNKQQLSSSFVLSKVKEDPKRENEITPSASRRFLHNGPQYNNQGAPNLKIRRGGKSLSKYEKVITSTPSKEILDILKETEADQKDNLTQIVKKIHVLSEMSKLRVKDLEEDSHFNNINNLNDSISNPSISACNTDRDRGEGRVNGKMGGMAVTPTKQILMHLASSQDTLIQQFHNTTTNQQRLQPRPSNASKVFAVYNIYGQSLGNRSSPKRRKKSHMNGGSSGLSRSHISNASFGAVNNISEISSINNNGSMNKENNITTMTIPQHNIQTPTLVSIPIVQSSSISNY